MGSLISQSPKGNQPKWADSEYFYKQDNFPGESLSEYICSLFLESSNCDIPFLTYRLTQPYVTKSPNYKPRFTMLPFERLVAIYLTETGYKSHLRTYKEGVINYWYKQFWMRHSAAERLKFVLTVFNYFGVSEGESLKYLTYMVELDTLVLNIDRHFNNFGLMYDYKEKRYKPMFLFDNGLSLCVGEGQLGSLKDMTDLRKVKMQPFSSRLSSNRNVLPPFKFPFDVVRFVDLVKDSFPFGLEYLKSSTQYIVFKHRLRVEYVKDCNGVDILEYLTNSGL